MGLHGIPRAGKTILYSTIIESIKTWLSTYPFLFYYNFSDQEKQSILNILYSLLSQLSSDDIPLEIQRFYEICLHGIKYALVMQLKEIFLSVMNRLSFESGNTIYI